MKQFNSVEDAYEAIGKEILCFVNYRSWSTAKGLYQVLEKSTAARWSMTYEGQETRKGELPPFEVASVASDAVLYLREDLLKTTGQRIWGLTFTLYPDGKFTVEYDHNKPEGYEETDETIDVSLPDFAAQINKK